MDVSELLNELNDAQREAVAAEPGPILVLAGAGSGKTRVLTYRIAWLVQVLGHSPLSVMAVTFTNKASREMRHRIESMLGFAVGGMWMGTFHGLSHKFLRLHWREAKLPQNFEIIDSEDQLRLVKRVIRELGLDEQYWPPKQLQWFINAHKEEGRRFHHLQHSMDDQQRQLQQIYEAYESLCERLGAVDFSEILLRVVETLRGDQVLRDNYQNKFKHILVDEFQDTNSIQYEWLRLFTGQHNNLLAVGDDDQSIYGWRGAKVENILQFEKDYPSTKMVRLEQNYRSTGVILRAANEVIRNNDGRLGKELWTDGDDGAPIKVYAAYNEFDEARFVIERINEWEAKGNKRDSVAILYRSNAQSRVFEQVLIDEGMPYRVYGGLRFFERQEIKDALAYLRLVSHRDSDSAFERVVNVPTRGIGSKTVDKIREQARAEQISLWQSAKKMLENQAISGKAASGMSLFIDIVETLDKQAAQVTLPELAESLIETSGLVEHYQKEKGERGQTRIENLYELVSALRVFQISEDEELDPLSSFLAHASLEAGEGQAEEWEECVQLMSLHSAKGLEFPLVFLVGMEEGLFPHQRSIDEPGQLEEERRLCYVGMTRAMQELYISYAEVRRLYGKENYATVSRFISEIPVDCMTEVRSSSKPKPYHNHAHEKSVSHDDFDFNQDNDGQEIRVGQRVRHPKFADGIITNIEGQGEYARIQINFKSAGSKWLVLSYAKLELIS